MEGGDAQVGYVLVHGAELGPWVWEDLLPLLRRPAVAVALPGRDGRAVERRRSLRLDDAVQAVVDDSRSLEADRIVLVCHSFSGVLAPAVAHRMGESLAGLVLLGATTPEEGRSWVDLLPAPQRLLLRLLYRLRPDGMRSPEAQNRDLLCHDLDEERTARVLQRYVAEAPRLLLDPVPVARMPEVPLHYVRLLDDRVMDEATRDRNLGRVPAAEVHDLASGHLPMMSRPAELAALLEGLAVAALQA